MTYTPTLVTENAPAEMERIREAIRPLVALAAADDRDEDTQAMTLLKLADAQLALAVATLERAFVMLETYDVERLSQAKLLLGFYWQRIRSLTAPERSRARKSHNGRARYSKPRKPAAS